MSVDQAPTSYVTRVGQKKRTQVHLGQSDTMNKLSYDMRHLPRSIHDWERLVAAMGEITDDTRDLGVVMILREGRVEIAHYVRPVERDAAGHLQRRPPAVLSARNATTGAMDHFHWAFTDELATRAGISRRDLEDERDARALRLTGAGSQPDARN